MTRVDNINSTNYKGVPALTPKVVHDYLLVLGRQWKNKGTAIELGNWLGGTAVPLLEGLVVAGYDKPFYAFDKWEATKQQVNRAKEQDIKIEVGQDLKPIFLNNVRKVYGNIELHKGRIEHTIQYYKGDIEICLFDAPKKDPVFSICINHLLPFFISGITVLGLLDYHCDRNKKGDIHNVQKDFIVNHIDRFEKIMEWPGECDCAFFKYRN